MYKPTCPLGCGRPGLYSGGFQRFLFTFAKKPSISTPIAITALHSLSPLGESGAAFTRALYDDRHYLSRQRFGSDAYWVGRLAADSQLLAIQSSDKRYKVLDRSVLMAICCARELWAQAGWDDCVEVGINLGASRGATALFERHYQSFLERGKVHSQASPSTTLGNLSSWVAQDLHLQGPHFSHSITCATGLHAVANAMAWLRAGFSARFIAGAAEAPLTPFTLAQFQALRIYAGADDPYPCQALNPSKKRNTMVLGEGVCLVALECAPRRTPLAWLNGLGFATESIGHAAAVSPEGDALFRSMKQAIGTHPLDEIDAIVTHAPGTLAGDRSECRAIERLFGSAPPLLVNNKWKLGHSFAASGLFNLQTALAMLASQRAPQIPYLTAQPAPGRIRNVLVNAMGFGGNAISLLVSRP